MKIISTVALTDTQREVIRKAVPHAELSDRQCRSTDDVYSMLAGGGDAMLTFRVPEDVAERAPTLRWIQLLSAGADHTPARVLSNRKLAVTTSSGIHATPIAEYTIASMLAYAHKFHQMMRAQVRREWARSGFMASIEDVRGKTMGIVGYGSIGRETARLGKALGMRVLALKRDPADKRDPGWCPRGVGDPEGTIPEKFFGPEQREAILRESDYISVTLPHTAHTHHFIGAREFSTMKPGAYIVNIGRGEVIDEAAMIEALRAGRVGGAGLDVFEKEPLPESSPLWEMENVILTPHMSGANKGYMEMASELFADNLRRFEKDQPLLNLVDPTLGY